MFYSINDGLSVKVINGHDLVLTPQNLSFKPFKKENNTVGEISLLAIDLNAKYLALGDTN